MSIPPEQMKTPSPVTASYPEVRIISHRHDDDNQPCSLVMQPAHWCDVLLDLDCPWTTLLESCFVVLLHEVEREPILRDDLFLGCEAAWTHQQHTTLVYNVGWALLPMAKWVEVAANPHTTALLYELL